MYERCIVPSAAVKLGDVEVAMWAIKIPPVSA